MKTLMKLAAVAAVALALATPAAAQPGFPYSIGTAKDFSWGVVIGGTFTPMATPGGGLTVTPTIRLGSGFTGEAVRIKPTFSTFASGTTANLTGLFVGTPTVTSNGATITNQANVKIDIPGTAATNNYSLWVMGAARFDAPPSFASGTVTTSQPFTVSQGWNASGVSFVGAQLTFTEAASAAGSQYLSILGGASGTTAEFSVGKGGTITSLLGHTISATTNQLALGTTNVTTYSAASPAASTTVNLSTTAGGFASQSTCGTTTTCTAAAATPNLITKFGSVALTSASPSTAVITGLPFTSTSSYVCTASPEGTTAAVAATGIAVSRTSASSLTLTGPNTVTTVINYVCTGI